MPGRQAHGRPVTAGPSGQKKSNNKRGPLPRTRGGKVDVLALAAKQVGQTKNKGVRLRDLDVEPEEGSRRRRRDDDEEEEGEEAGGHSGKRRRRNDADNGDGADDDSDDSMQSDSDGNEWHTGFGSDDNDSEIDSDEAFGESDDDVLEAFTFRGSSSFSSKRKKQRATKKDEDSEGEFDGFDKDGEDDEDDDESVGDDGASLGDEAIDLAAALDQVSSDEEEEETKSRGKKNRVSRDTNEDSDTSVSDSDALDGKEEKAPIKKSQRSRDSDDDSEASTDDSDSDSEFSVSSDPDNDGQDNADAFKHMASEFVGGKTNDSEAGADATDTDEESDLDADGMVEEKRRKNKVTVSKPRMQQDRLHRVVAADKAHETLGRWVETVKQNRRAEHLSFPTAGSLASSGLNPQEELRPISKRSAQTELEKTILTIMEESGLGPSERAGEKQQQQQQQQNGDASTGQDENTTLSPEELRQLVGQQRRRRELQSQETARAKRIKKIKSKAYRRVHRREKAKAEALLAEEALEAGGEDVDSEEEREAQHRQRAMERMGSRHRESKWAKRAKNTGRAVWDDEFRSGLVDMAVRDEELRRRVERRASSGEDSDSSGSSDDDEGADDETFRQRIVRDLKKAGQDASKGPESGLMNIAFMKKAEEARKKENDEAIDEIMRELNSDSGEDEDVARKETDDEAGASWTTVGRRKYGMPNVGQTSAAQLRKQRAAAADDENDGDADKPKIANGKTVQAKGKTSAKVAGAGAGLDATKEAALEPEVVRRSAPHSVGSWTTKKKSDKSSHKTKTGGILAGLDDAMAELVSHNHDEEARRTTSKATAAAAAAAVSQAQKSKKATAASMTADDSETSSSGSDDDSEDDDDNNNGNNGKNGNAAARQDSRGVAKTGTGRQSVRLKDVDLFLKALGDDDAAADFAREKAEHAAAEAAEAEAAASGSKEAFLPGWGSWAGEGLSSREAKWNQKQALRARTGGKKATAGAGTATRRDAKLDRVIISERRVRKNDMYLASALPHEFETKNQYERSLRLPVGPEWGTKIAFQDATKPRLLMKQGVVLPMAKPSI